MTTLNKDDVLNDYGFIATPEDVAVLNDVERMRAIIIRLWEEGRL